MTLMSLLFAALSAERLKSLLSRKRNSYNFQQNVMKLWHCTIVMGMIMLDGNNKYQNLPIIQNGNILSWYSKDFTALVKFLLPSFAFSIKIPCKFKQRLKFHSWFGTIRSKQKIGKAHVPNHPHQQLKPMLWPNFHQQMVTINIHLGEIIFIF